MTATQEEPAAPTYNRNAQQPSNMTAADFQVGEPLRIILYFWFTLVNILLLTHTSRFSTTFVFYHVKFVFGLNE